MKVGTVWDRTVDVLRGRGGILATLAMLYIFLPAVVSAGVTSYAAPGGALALVGGIVSLAVVVLLVFGLLAITAVATDPATGRADATLLARRRLGAAFGLMLVAGIVVSLLFVPGLVAMVVAGVTIDAAGNANVDAAAPGMLLLSALLLLAALLVGLWCTARLVPLFPVILAERRGLGAFARSIALTRGSTLRLIGVILLYAIVTGVVLLAASSVVGVVARLLLGEEGRATVAFIVAVAGAAVTAGASVVQAAFYAQYYAAARDVDGARSLA